MDTNAIKIIFTCGEAEEIKRGDRHIGCHFFKRDKKDNEDCCYYLSITGICLCREAAMDTVKKILKDTEETKGKTPYLDNLLGIDLLPKL